MFQLRHTLFTLFILTTASVVCAQEVRVQVATEEPPYYVGVGAIIQFTVDGLQADPRPKCELLEPQDGLRVVLLGLNPQIISQRFFSGGQMKVSERVTYKIQFRVTAEKAGDFQVGPFLIKQGKTEKRIDSFEMSFKAVPISEDMKVKLIMPETAYPDQRVPVTIEWWFAGDLDNLNELSIHSELFDKFRFLPDEQPRRRGSQMPIQTNQGELALSATARQETIDGTAFTILSSQRTMVPDRPGKFELQPITATIQLVTRWQRQRSAGGFGSIFDDMLGSRRRPAKVELFRAEGETVTFQVKSFPNENKPESFTGTVGKGFNLDVSADRTVVRTGDPIRLTIRLRGDGNVEGASMPPLSADNGLDPERFRLPERDITGEFKDGAKEFVVSVRVQDENVNEIPAIAYSWFDTDTETYLTTRSDPIALRVDPTVMVGADAVVSNQPKTDRSIESQSTGSIPQIQKTYSLTGADLAIEPDPAKLLISNDGLLGQSSVQAAGYGVGALFLVFAFWDRKRRQIDPEQRRAMDLVQRERRRISDAANRPAKEAAKEIADALRNVAAEFSNRDRTNMQLIVSECEAVTYKPEGASTEKIDFDLVDRALKAMDDLSRRSSA